METPSMNFTKETPLKLYQFLVIPRGVFISNITAYDSISAHVKIDQLIKENKLNALFIPLSEHIMSDFLKGLGVSVTKMELVVGEEQSIPKEENIVPPPPIDVEKNLENMAALLREKGYKVTKSKPNN